MENGLRLLTDAQMRQFLTEGYVLLKTDFPESFHRRLVEQLSDVYRTEGNPGNNLLPRVRELQKVFDHPVVKGALTSVLGPDYSMHAHRHGHYNNSPKPGGWHKDSYWGYSRMRNHRPWWAMIMYFPQDTPVELGPTGIMPGTQCYESRTFASDESEGEVTAAGAAGTFALIHYDIWHRSTANVAGRERFMLKFEFMRTQAPTGPSWDNRDPVWRSPSAIEAPLHAHEAMWRDAWRWLMGRDEAADAVDGGGADVAALLERLRSADAAERTLAADRLALLGPAAAAAGAVPALAGALADAFEPAALNAAYGLARMGDAGVAALLAALGGDAPAVSRCAAYGLAVAGEAALGGLLAALASDRDETAARAAFALGEQRAAAASAPAVRALAALLERPSERLRQAAVDALGNVGAYRGDAAADAGVAALARALRDADVQVRFMAGLALAKWGARAEAAVPALVEALDDDNRYVRAHAAEALYYIGTPNAKEALLDFLRGSRWCPTTTPASTFYP
ncbi:HEAT repeat domain-containing protein [Paenibacillus flagellatus]|uniref:Phytanoyl-CoA dioxygenase n=1 Tax=Paenibacillus flagellatus TaxID=2211139 RepID=A0A2V5K3V4_9BACL|nr:HEAT repeat domain-containing protein [Paenibacillus flagellatus]PYI53332.1 phytanoyl-CoA dioxygenase [Paenibacillus flagellatus]